MSRNERVGVLVGELIVAGVTLWEDGGRLRYRAPKGIMTEPRLEVLREHRDDVLAYLREPAMTTAVPDPAARHAPFPVTDVQSAYLLGRREVFAYGGVACHGYGELTYSDLDTVRLERAWQSLVERHGMLRAVVSVDGAQQVLPEVPDYRIAVADLRGEPAAQFTGAVEAARTDLSHRVHQPDQWPLFELRVTRGDATAVLHFSIDFLIADFVSIEVLLDELHRRYHDPTAELPRLEISYRDYRVAEQQVRGGVGYQRDRAYWLSRVGDLPPAPDLPVLRPAGQATPVRFRRWEARLDPAAWAGLRQRAGQHQVSPSTAVLAAFAETIAAFSRGPRFTLDVTLLNRLPVHPQVDRLVGDFTSVSLLAVDRTAGETFAGRAAAVQAQLWQDLDHRLFSGVEVMREIGRQRGADAALMPIVFTSAIGLADRPAQPLDHPAADPTATPDAAPSRGELTYGISQTPQVWIDCQNIERGGGLASNWDVREGVLPDDVLDDAFAAYQDLLRRLAAGDEAWCSLHPIGLPERQRARRAEVNATDGPLPDGLLHDPVLAQAARQPDRLAVLTPDRVLTYGELAQRSAEVAARLRGHGLSTGEPVAVVMDKGWEQVVAVVGVLRAGGAYLPVDTNQPVARRARILADAGVRLILSQSWLAPDPPDATTGAVLAVDQLAPAAGADDVAPAITTPDDLAYVIYTSGSTGTPKGVMISHRAARNTVDDMTRRFGIGADDRVLSLAQLGFDLSVYDVFGPLAVGGALVLPAAGRRADASHWATVIADHGVTVWNSVPAQLQMLTDYLAAVAQVELPTLRLALLSGDWIPVALPDALRTRLPGVKLVSLGGATEAAIWSIYHEISEVPAEWRSIPYGRPLTNQRWHVLDADLRPCPDRVTGELYIAGAGLALGYLNDEAKTAAQFITHPDTGERLYRTGDLGRYLPNGEIEFLGREDSQVKIRGHRIELAEVESAMADHPAVSAAACVAAGTGADRTLAGFVEPAPTSASDLTVATRTALATATAAGAAVLDGVDWDRYLAYLRRLDELALATMLGVFTGAGLFTGGASHSTDEILAATRVADRHQRLVRRWLHALRAEKALAADAAGNYRLTLAGAAFRDLDITAGWREVAARAAGVDDVRLTDYFQATGARLAELIRGEEDPLGLLFPQGRVDVSDDLYAEALFNRWANAVTAAAVRQVATDHTGPGPLRVLEVGAGAGGTSAAVLAALGEVTQSTGQLVDYLYTDLSQFFLNAASQRFGVHPGLRFAVYDLDRDPQAQGLSANSFDLIIAGDVLHATVDVGGTLGRLEQLAAPGGWLVVQEMTRDHLQIMTSLELLVRLHEGAGDFADVRQGRHQTFLDPQQWHRLLAAAGANAVCDTGGDDQLAQIGMRVFLARWKPDRQRVTPAEVANHVATVLPEYMVPSVLEVVDTMPLTDNGKVDRAALLRRLPDRGGPAPAEAEEGGSDLERRLAGIWAEVLKVDRVGRQQNFYELGGDSLLAAQLTGRLVEQVPEANRFFDELLQLIMERPTVAALAESLMEAPLTAPEGQPEPAGDADGGAAAPPAAVTGEPAPVLVRLAATGGADGPEGGAAHVLVHDGTGLVRAGEPLAAALAGTAPVYGLAGDAGLPVTDLPPATLRARLADRYCAQVVAAELRQVRLLGYGPAAALTVELARRLTEVGLDVTAVALLAPAAPELALADETVLGWWFARQLGADPVGLGLPGEAALADAVAAVCAVTAGSGTAGAVPAAALAALAETAPAGSDRAAVGRAAAAWQARPLPERLAAVADAAGADPAAVTDAYPLFRGLLAGAATTGEFYVGDLTVLAPADAGPLGALLAAPAETWQAQCLGEVSTATVPGDHWSCLGLPYVADLAAAVGSPEVPAAGALAAGSAGEDREG